MDPPQSRPTPPKPPRKRNRPAVSCGHCRTRKLKCSRTQPCDSCHRSGDSATCSYELRRHREPGVNPNPVGPDELMARVNRLESLLVSAMATNAQSTAKPGGISDAVHAISGLATNGDSAPSSVSQNLTDPKSTAVGEMTREFGSMKVDQVENSSIYLGGGHWVSIMSEIEEFRKYLDENHEELECVATERHMMARDASRYPSLLRGSTTPASREELESYVPSRDVTDRLVDRFFEFYGSTRPIIHEPTFRKEYARYLEDPTAAKTIWLGLLFSMLHLAELSSAEEAGQAPPEIAGRYKLRTIQCLISANYTFPVGYTVETLMLYMDGEWMISRDPNIEASIILGLAVRLAMRMGIHRDSKVFSHISPFRAEMRRRLWAAIHSADILHSFMMSLPPVISQSDCDCGLPMNVKSEDFGEDTELPPSKTLEEPTEVTYMIVKYQLLLVVEKIVQFARRKGDGSIETVSTLEQSLLEARQKIPSHLQIGHERGDGPVRLKRAEMSVDRVVQLGLCLLHRKILHLRNDPSVLERRGSCVNAAMTLLRYQSAMFLEEGTSGRPTRNMANLTSQEWFVAGMIVALDLYYGVEAERQSPSPSDMSIWGYSRRTEMVSALETSTYFWSTLRDESILAAKAYGLFSHILAKVKNALILLGEMSPGNVVPLEQPTYAVDTELLDNMPEFNWDFWDSYNGGEQPNIETFLQSPTK